MCNFLCKKFSDWLLIFEIATPAFGGLAMTEGMGLPRLSFWKASQWQRGGDCHGLPYGKPRNDRVWGQKGEIAMASLREASQ
jgi:hypothetical protein